MKNSSIVLFVDDHPAPITSFIAPVKFELDTIKLADGKHTIKVVSEDPNEEEGNRCVPSEVRNGPAISFEGTSGYSVVDGILPLMINVYGKGDSNEIYITDSETPQSIRAWV